MIAVIQCAASKRPEAGRFLSKDGKPVVFVADPASAPHDGTVLFARPDDISDCGVSWRQLVMKYNDRGDNPEGLLPAYQLYKNPAYGRLVDELGVEKVYILSAGWGLISAGFLTPYYDITFSQCARGLDSYKHRKPSDHYDDFRMLRAEANEKIAFFGGKSYLGLFADLTNGTPGQRIIFYNSSFPPVAPGCEVKRYETSTRTNWHYECAKAFLDGRL